MLKLIVGLGNPGAEYEDTRHNAGFWWLDRVARELGVHPTHDRGHHAMLARTTLAGQPLWLMWPQTFMNRSGVAVASLARFYKIAPEDILVAHDELDLAPGLVKLKQGGGHAGHNGLRDLHAQLGSPNYWRLRIGVGHPGDRAEVVNWVLKKPSPTDRSSITNAMDKALQQWPVMAKGDMLVAMRHLHAPVVGDTPRPPKPPRPVQSIPGTKSDPSPTVASRDCEPTRPEAVPGSIAASSAPAVP
jgi:PTH1 family peptidyl-tRNA hydrolase